MRKTISAFKARTRFGRLLNEVYYQGSEYVIERFGSPVAKITPIAPGHGDGDSLENFMTFAGTLSETDARRMKRTIRAARRTSAHPPPTL